MLRGTLPYRIPKSVSFTEDDLWDTDRKEYHAWGYPEIVYNIIQGNPKITYDGVKGILQKYNVPVDLGYIIRAIKELVTTERISYLNRRFLVIKE